MIERPAFRSFRFLTRLAAVALAMAVSLFGVPLRADDLLLSRFGDYLESLRAQAGIPGLAASIVGPSDVVWERAFGQQNIERLVVTRADTPFHIDGLTQLFTAALVLRCVEEGRLSLDDRIGQYARGAADGEATLGQLLTHTSTGAGGLVFAYRPDRLDPLASAVSACRGDSWRGTVAALLDQLAMSDSVPGPDVIQLVPPPPDIPASAVARYSSVLDRLATPYSVDTQGRASPSRYSATTLRPASGLISTIRNVAKFDLALKQGQIVRAQTLALAWSAPLGRDGQPLPHGLGWFVQSYNGEPMVWQFGLDDNASSSLVVTMPRRGVTMILLANSPGLAKPFALAAGDVTVSPFVRLFLGIFVR
jgi:CubicO group peptidase (beta-lactamase class C family)